MYFTGGKAEASASVLMRKLHYNRYNAEHALKQEEQALLEGFQVRSAQLDNHFNANVWALLGKGRSVRSCFYCGRCIMIVIMQSMH